jgi:KDO2-lipid IV(A) lauroyltransferase
MHDLFCRLAEPSAFLSLRSFMYYIIYGALYILSLLPLRVLYLLSSFAYFIIYHVASYRKRVVMQNLQLAFPEKTDEERTLIAKKFYKNFCDTFIETIKLVSAGKNFIEKHFTADYAVFEKLYAAGKKCQIHTGHNFNWEIANLSMAANIPFDFLGVYMPIENKAVDRLFKKFRTKTGTILLPATDMRTAILPWRNKQYALGLIADQSAGNLHKAYWVPFFGKPAPFVRGPESGARLGNIPVVFGHFTKKKRGYYQGHYFLAEENPRQLPDGELTRKYIRYLEEVVREHPEMWLWSHRRWKHEWHPDYKPIISN